MRAAAQRGALAGNRATAPEFLNKEVKSRRKVIKPLLTKMCAGGRHGGCWSLNCTCPCHEQHGGVVERTKHQPSVLRKRS